MRSYANALRAQTIEAGRRARRELLLLIPVLAAIVLAFAFRGELFGAEGSAVRWITAGALLLIGWEFARSLGRALEPWLARRLDPGAAGVAGFLIRVAALIALILVSLGIVGIKPGALFLGASFTAVMLGLAAQQTIGNILAGFVLISTHPFQIGDRVRFHGFGMDVEGTVAAHGLLHLTLTDGDDMVKIPNNTALTMAIRPLRQPASVDMRARLPVGADPEEVEKTVMEATSVRTREPPHIVLEEFDGEYIVVRIKATPSDHRDGGKLAREILDAVSGLYRTPSYPDAPRADQSASVAGR